MTNKTRTAAGTTKKGVARLFVGAAVLALGSLAAWPMLNSASAANNYPPGPNPSGSSNSSNSSNTTNSSIGSSHASSSSNNSSNASSHSASGHNESSSSNSSNSSNSSSENSSNASSSNASHSSAASSNSQASNSSANSSHSGGASSAGSGQGLSTDQRTQLNAALGGTSTPASDVASALARDASDSSTANKVIQALGSVSGADNASTVAAKNALASALTSSSGTDATALVNALAGVSSNPQAATALGEALAGAGQSGQNFIVHALALSADPAGLAKALTNPTILKTVVNLASNPPAAASLTPGTDLKAFVANLIVAAATRISTGDPGSVKTTGSGDPDGSYTVHLSGLSHSGGSALGVPGGIRYYLSAATTGTVSLVYVPNGGTAQTYSGTTSKDGTTSIVIPASATGAHDAAGAKTAVASSTLGLTAKDASGRLVAFAEPAGSLGAVPPAKSGSGSGALVAGIVIAAVIAVGLITLVARRGSRLATVES